MDFVKEKEKLDKFYLEHQNEEEVFMSYLWDEFEKKKKNLEKFVGDEFEKVTGGEIKYEIHYDEHFRHFKINVKGFHLYTQTLIHKIREFREKYFVEEIKIS